MTFVPEPPKPATGDGNGRRRFPIWKVLFASIVLLEIVGGILWFSLSGPSSSSDPPAPSSVEEGGEASPAPSFPSESGDGGTGIVEESDEPNPEESDEPNPSRSAHRLARRSINEQGRYTFRHPTAWQVSIEGSVSKVVAPDESISVSFGLGGTGSLESSSELLTDSLRETYEMVVVEDTSTDPIGGLRSRVIEGDATTRDGVNLRFIAATVPGSDQHYSIVAFVAADRSENIPPRIQAVVNSFRVIARV